MVIATSWDWQEGRMHGTLLAGTQGLVPNSGYRSVPPQLLLPLLVVVEMEAPAILIYEYKFMNKKYLNNLIKC